MYNYANASHVRRSLQSWVSIIQRLYSQLTFFNILRSLKYYQVSISWGEVIYVSGHSLTRNAYRATGFRLHRPEDYSLSFLTWSNSAPWTQGSFLFFFQERNSALLNQGSDVLILIIEHEGDDIYIAIPLFSSWAEWGNRWTRPSLLPPPPPPLPPPLRVQAKKEKKRERRLFHKLAAYNELLPGTILYLPGDTPASVLFQRKDKERPRARRCC